MCHINTNLCSAFSGSDPPDYSEMSGWDGFYTGSVGGSHIIQLPLWPAVHLFACLSVYPLPLL